MSRVLLTGGTGRLGTELRALLPDAVAPGRAEMDVTDPAAVRRVADEVRPDVIVHAAAYTDVGGAERERAACWRVNVGGTRAVVAAARGAGARLVHVSTDYVFWGDRGGYREDDPPGPVRNYYALTKLVAEEAALSFEGTLVLRTSFRPRDFPYPVAFDDVFTGQDYVDAIAPMIARAVLRVDDIPHRVLHVVTERKSVFDLARRRRPDVRRGSRADAGVELPEDVSLDTSRWRALERAWDQEEEDARPDHPPTRIQPFPPRPTPTRR